MNSEFLSDILECSVCLKPLDEYNKVLPCQHTFCKSCLQSIVKSHKELRCPECRVVVQQRVEDLPSNILLIRLLDGIRFQQKQFNSIENCQTVDTRRHSIDGVLSESALSNCNTKENNRKIASKPFYVHEHAKSDPAATKTRSSSSKPHAVALYTYRSDEPSDLPFAKGDTIWLLKKVDQNWMSGECNGSTGVFPVNYVKIVQPLPTERPYCTALYDFEIDPEDPDKDCLHFSKNDRISIIRKVDENWAEGMLRDKIGIFPLSFVKLNDESRKMIDDSSSDGAKSHRTNVVSAAARRLSSKQAGKNTKKRHSFPVFNTARNKSDSSTPSYRHSVEFGDSPLTLASSSREESCFESAIEPGTSADDRPEVPGSIQGLVHVNGNAEQGLKSSAPSNSNEQLDSPKPSPQDGSSPKPTTSAKVVVAAYPYKSRKPDELELLKGDSYIVAEVCRDGWCRGSHVISGKSGVFPGNYVTPIPTSLSVTSQAASSVRPSSLTQSRDSSSACDSSRPASRTYEDFLNLQASKSEKSSRSKRPRSAFPFHSTSSRANPPAAGLKPASSRTSPERQRPSTARSSSATSNVDITLMAKLVRSAPPRSPPPRSPPPRPAPPSSTSVHHRRTSRRATIQRSLSSEEDKPAASTSRPPFRKANLQDFQNFVSKQEKKRDKGFKEFMKAFSSGGGKSKSSSSPSSTSPSDLRLTTSKPSVKPLQRDHFVAIMNYPADDLEELSLQEGDVVVVHSRRPDGWFKGTNLASGDTGQFPSTFVEKMSR